MAENNQKGKQHNLNRSMKNRNSGKGKAHVATTTKNKTKHRAINKTQDDPLETISYRCKHLKPYSPLDSLEKK